MLRAAQGLMRQIPDDKMSERVIPNRDRAIRLLTHHVFRIGEAFLETAIDGTEYADPAREHAARRRHLHDRQRSRGATASEVIGAHRSVVGELADKSGTQKLPTYLRAAAAAHACSSARRGTPRSTRASSRTCSRRYGIKPNARAHARGARGAAAARRGSSSRRAPAATAKKPR